jgi:hypothetical protein
MLVTLSKAFGVSTPALIERATEKDPPPVGRVVLRERDAMGERIWLVACEQPDGREQRLKVPERSLRPLTGS